MWRKPLNNAILATATHRELGKVVDETSTQVEVQIINKWRMNMTQKKKIEREHCSNLNCLSNQL